MIYQTQLPPFFSVRKYRLLDAILVVGLVVVIGIAILLRIVALKNIPGINGDEAWYGVKLAEFRNGGEYPLRTQLGNLSNPFYLLPLYMIELIFPHSFVVLRLVSLMSGLLLVVFSYFLLLQASDRKTALIYTLLMAVLPVNIAYSRFGEEPSQFVLATLFPIFFVLRNQWIWAGIAGFAALLVHPTMLFLSPVLLGLSWEHLRKRRVSLPPGSAWGRFFIVGVVACLVFLRLRSLPRFWIPSIFSVYLRAKNLKDWLVFAVSYGRLFSGITIYQYISGGGRHLTALVHDIGFWMICLPVVFFGLRIMLQRKNWRFLGLFSGLVVSLVIFYLVMSLGGINPGHERYALWLIAPSTLVFALCLRSLMTNPLRFRLIFSAILLTSGLLIGSFYSNYFQVILETGGLAHRTFWTAAEEPKKQALAIVKEDAQGRSNVSIITEDWWLYWPIRYLSYNSPGISVETLEGKGGRERLDEVLLEGGYAVGFVGGPIEEYVTSHFADNERHFQIFDYAGRTILQVWTLSSTGAS